MVQLSKLGLSRRFRLLPMLCAIGLCFVVFMKVSYKNRTNQTVIDVDKWAENPTVACNSHFIGYGNEFAVLRYAHVDRTRKTFSIPCLDKIPKYKFLHRKEGTILNEWIANLEMIRNTVEPTHVTSTRTTIAIMRIEAHNLYHTLCEWYNVFIVARLLNLQPKHIDILFMDDRPPSLLDDTWDILFGNVSRVKDLPAGAVFKNLVWNVIGYESPANFHNLRHLPYVDEFYEFFIHSFGAREYKSLDCKRLDVTVIWRRDYMTHPERQELTGGLVHRKFQNENEILTAVNEVLPGQNVKAVILEEMSMDNQISLFTNTDILIGMHGAGMSHTLFLPKHAAVLETFPNYWGFLTHFKAFARWRGIKYLGWQNKDKHNEFDNYYTRIPPEVLRSHLKLLKSYLCPP